MFFIFLKMGYHRLIHRDTFFLLVRNCEGCELQYNGIKANERACDNLAVKTEFSR